MAPPWSHEPEAKADRNETEPFKMRDVQRPSCQALPCSEHPAAAAVQPHSAVRSPLGTEGKTSGEAHTELLLKVPREILWAVTAATRGWNIDLDLFGVVIPI